MKKFYINHNNALDLLPDETNLLENNRIPEKPGYILAYKNSDESYCIFNEMIELNCSDLEAFKKEIIETNSRLQWIKKNKQRCHSRWQESGFYYRAADDS